MPNEFARLLSIVILAAVFVYGCPKPDEKNRSTLKDVDYEQAVGMINSQNPPVIIDVRSGEEFNGELGHIPGARLIPIENMADSMKEVEQFKERDILMVCRSGRRSSIAGKQLIDAGFRNIYNLKGGMKVRNEKGGAIEKNAD